MEQPTSIPGWCWDVTSRQHPVSILTPLTTRLATPRTQPSDEAVVQSGRLRTFRERAGRLLVPSCIRCTGFIVLPAHLVLPVIMHPWHVLCTSFLHHPHMDLIESI